MSMSAKNKTEVTKNELAADLGFRFSVLSYLAC